MKEDLYSVWRAKVNIDTDVLARIFLNVTAAYYAVIIASIVAPLYVFLLRRCIASAKKVVCKSIKRRRSFSIPSLMPSVKACGAWPCRAVSSLARTVKRVASLVYQKKKKSAAADKSPAARRRSASRQSEAASTSAEFMTPATKGSSRSRSRSPRSSGRISPPRGADDEEEISPKANAKLNSPSMKGDAFTVYGQPVKVVPVFRDAKKSPAAKVRDAIRDRYRAHVSSKNTTVDVSNAMRDGEVFALPRPSVLSLERLVEKVFWRQRRFHKYQSTNITHSALDELYSRPAFQQWYEDNRDSLLSQVQQRNYTTLWRSLSILAFIVAGLVALPAFDFNNRAVTLTREKSSGSSASFSQLLQTRYEYVKYSRTSLPWLPTRAAASQSALQGLLVRAVGWCEIITIVTAVVALLTSAFMPRGVSCTAATMVVSLAAILAECRLIDGVRVNCGMGIIVLGGVAAVAVAKSLA